MAIDDGRAVQETGPGAVHDCLVIGQQRGFNWWENGDKTLPVIISAHFRPTRRCPPKAP
ncbi:hypothetical protein ACVIIZ_000980 [Bradyrhizobium sp. USDA 4523]|nr:hypothetical protein [Bradyrhizobium sp. USDA 4538]MCP1903691.1 hypothetical protein [Bradyrhizobium sp. USDA 4537]